MRKIAALCILLLATCPYTAAGVQGGPSGSPDTSVRASWKLDAKPLDMAHTLDNKKVYILGDDAKVHVYTTDGTRQGSIAVDKGVTGIDIAPRGEMLYLINELDNTFTSLAVSFTATIDVTDAPFLGNENAPVVLAVFSDFQ
jgi:hypothetical protein